TYLMYRCSRAFCALVKRLNLHRSGGLPKLRTRRECGIATARPAPNDYGFPLECGATMQTDAVEGEDGRHATSHRDRNARRRWCRAHRGDACIPDVFARARVRADDERLRQ